MAVDVCNLLALAPTHSAIRGTEHIDTATFKGNNHGPVGLHQRFAAQPAGMIRRCQSLSPRKPAVARYAHQNIAAAVRLIPLGIAIPVERTRGCVVAHGPILVIEMSLIDDDRVSPH